VTTDIGYWALPDSSDPYLVARIRWPDVAEAISLGCPEWQHDVGLFDLPYDHHSRSLTEDEAAMWAARWGATLPQGALAEPPLVLIRRMPATWSNPSPADRRAWALDGVALPRQAVSSEAARPERPSWWARLVARRARPSAAAGADRDATPLDSTEPDGSQPETFLDDPSGPARRQRRRVNLEGTVRIQVGKRAVTADLVDLSEAGLRCLVRRPYATPPVGRRVAAPFTVSTPHTSHPLDLDVSGAITWRKAVDDATHLGIALDALDDDQSGALRALLDTVTDGERS
jgi:hypothetical protein